MLSKIAVFGQDKRSIKQYQEQAAELSTLFRGRLPAKYPYLYNGTYFMYGPAFYKGDLFYNGKRYYDVWMNIDAFRMDLLVRPGSEQSPVVAYKNLVCWFTLGAAKYVNLEYMGFEDAPDGYFEILSDGTAPVLKQIRKTFRSSSQDHNGPDIGYEDPEYKDDVVNYFRFEESFYTIKGGKVEKIKKRAAQNLLRKGVHYNEGLVHDRMARQNGDSTPAAVDSKAARKSGLGLPDGYFSAETTADDYAAGPETQITATYRNKLYIIGTAGKNNGRAKIGGVVTDLETGHPLEGALVYDGKTSSHTLTGKDGSYKITLPVGENTLHFSYEGKENIDLTVEIRGDGRLDLQLPDRIELLKASVVSAGSMESHRSTAMGVESVSMKTMNKIPSAFGEGDILKGVLTLPGVKSVGEASGGFNVRGGSQDQNLILFNGNTIYNPSHLFGLFSAFNPDIVESVELYKSSIPAEYGGRISSVMTVKSKEGSAEKFKGSAGIGLLTSRLHLEGPIVKGKTSFILGGRTTYSDWLLKQLPKDSNYSDGTASFSDANVGITHRFSDKDVLQLSGYWASDRFSFSADTVFRYSNYNISARFRHKDKDGGEIKASVGFDHFTSLTGLYAWETNASDIETVLRQVFLRTSRTHAFKTNRLSYGLDVVGYGFAPGNLTPHGEGSLVIARSLDTEMGAEPSAYISDDWDINEVFSLESGLRLSSFLAFADKSFYCGPEFRLSGRYSPLVNLSFKGGINTMRQYVHLISNTASVSPMDTWKLSGGGLAPTTGWQAAGGAYWTHLGTGIDFSAELYWKQTKNGLDYKPGAQLVMNENLAQDLVPVLGRNWGVELMAKRSTGKVSGWVSYCYSRALLKEMEDRGAETIAGGAWYNAPYDKPHEFKFVGNWAITHRYSLSLNLDYSTGRPITIPTGKYYFAGAWRMAYSSRNVYRIPDYFRMDLALNIDPGHYLKAIAHSSITLGVYNLTGRRNPYSVFFRSNASGDIQGYMLSVFATQIPYINLNILF